MDNFQIYAVKKDGRWLDILREPTDIFINADLYGSLDMVETVAEAHKGVAIDITAQIRTTAQKEMLDKVRKKIPDIIVKQSKHKAVISLDDLIEALYALEAEISKEGE